jgi:ribose transport system permease protein
MPGNPARRILVALTMKETVLLYVLLLVCGFVSLVNPQFLTMNNLLTIIKQTTIVTIVAVGQTFIITSGGIDLSVGYVMGMSSIVVSEMLSFGVGIIPAIALGILVSTLLGALTGLIISRLRLPPFIVTLGMANIARGLVLVITQGFVVQVDNKVINYLGMGDVGKVPVMALFMPVMVFAGWFLLNKTVFGNHIKALGGNETAARLCGINVGRSKVFIYLLGGVFCGIAGILMTGRLNGGNPNAGLTLDMDSIGAVIVGGTSLSGGSGTIIGTLLGALLMGVIRNGLVLMNVNMYWQTVVTGVIVIAVCGTKEALKDRGRHNLTRAED